MTQTDMPKLYTRQKTLLALLQAFGGYLPSVALQKYLFLYTQMCESDKSYEFVPYRFGCFSFQSYADRRKLIELEVLQQSDQWELKDNDVDFLAMLKVNERKKMKIFYKRFRNLKGDDLVREVYKAYPYYAIKSEIAKKIMPSDDLKKIEEVRPLEETYKFFTIGYEGQSFEHYLNRLIINNVKTLVDVRKNPLSRKYGFSKNTLSEALKNLGIEYVHIPELGITSEKRQKLNSQADYNRLFDNYEKTTLVENVDALKKLFSLFIEKKRLAITCFEAEHCMCHRGRVANALSNLPEWKYEIVHI